MSTVIWNDIRYLESDVATGSCLFGARAQLVSLAAEARISKMHDFDEAREL